ncbi:CPBP family intramembrane glutamic endopeptidase [uncultured Chitinophaga sp.]|jgi:CAAX amino terminal protease family.|uniref:CPBP family intramembrane glutamic endopeptidase n=1 Tax=uncultured Chitinophaga sp. TaxID=339340 RepID=UPI002635524B|nr:CPBP family intramembrane glutamic endopeptidase [uncultured Chitinophaga sp.]
MENNPAIRKNIATYLVITTILCLPVYYLCIRTGNISAGFPPVSYTVVIMWCPALAALLTCLLRGIPLASLGWKWGRHKYQLWSYLIPFLYALVAYLGVWISGKGGFYDKEFVGKIAKGFGWNLPDGAVIILFVILSGIFGMVRAMSSALGEEIGWRGFLTPQLMKLSSYTATSLWMGLIWSLYHYPLLLGSNYNTGGSKLYSLICFTVMVFAICFVFTWMRMKSGSLWTATLLHASHNLFIQMVFTPITVDTGETTKYIDEFGIALPIVTVVLAFIFWRKRHELPPAQQEETVHPAQLENVV